MLYIGGTLLAREFTVLTLQFVQTEGTVNNKREDVRIKRLLVKVRGAHSNGLDSIFLIFTTRDHNDLGQWRKPKNLFQQAEAFRGSSRVGWQAKIQGNHVGLFTPQHRQSRFSVRCDAYFKVIAEAPAHLALESGIVFYDQESSSHNSIKSFSNVSLTEILN
jgi:hypothetical protein